MKTYATKPVATCYGTIGEFQTARAYVGMNPEQFEAYAQELHSMIVQLVMDSENGFNIQEQMSLPRLKDGFTLLDIHCWMLLLQIWFHNLRFKTQKTFCTARFIWA